MAGERWESESAAYLAPQPGAGDAWGEEAAAHGRRGTQRLLYVGLDAPPPSVAAALGTGGEAVVVRRRLILADDQPVEITTSYYPAAIAAGTPLATPAKIRGGAVAILASLGYRSSDVHESVSARMPTNREKDLLALAEGVPVLVLERTILSSDGQPFEYTQMTMTPERHLHYRMRG